MIIVLIILILLLIGSIHLMFRNIDVLVFTRKLVKIAGDYHLRHLEIDLEGEESAFNWFADKHPYWRFLFSLKPLELEYWFTREELDKINS